MEALFRNCLGFHYSKPKRRTRKPGTEQLARTRDTHRAKQSCTDNFRRTCRTQLIILIEYRTQLTSITSPGLGSAQPRVRRHTASTDAPRHLVSRARRRRTLIARLLLPRASSRLFRFVGSSVAVCLSVCLSVCFSFICCCLCCWLFLTVLLLREVVVERWSLVSDAIFLRV